MGLVSRRHTWYDYGMTHETKVVVRIEPSLKQVCERIAASKDETLSQVLRRALREYAEANAQQPLPLGHPERMKLANARPRARKKL